MTATVEVWCHERYHDSDAVFFERFELGDDGSVIMTDESPRGRFLPWFVQLDAEDNEVAEGEQFFHPRQVRYSYRHSCSCGYRAEWNDELLDELIRMLVAGGVPRIGLRRLDEEHKKRSARRRTDGPSVV